jgi:hypothetical protein
MASQPLGFFFRGVLFDLLSQKGIKVIMGYTNWGLDY